MPITENVEEVKIKHRGVLHTYETENAITTFEPEVQNAINRYQTESNDPRESRTYRCRSGAGEPFVIHVQAKKGTSYSKVYAFKAAF